jgi:hypothetical protein
MNACTHILLAVIEMYIQMDEYMKPSHPFSLPDINPVL